MSDLQKNMISDEHLHGSGAASSGRLLRSNHDLNRLNFPMDHQNLINICVFEQFEGLLFSDLIGPLTQGRIGANPNQVNKVELYQCLVLFPT